MLGFCLNCEGIVASSSYIGKKKQNYAYRTTNVVDLIHRVKSNNKKEKRKTIIITAVAISALVLSGLIISR